MRVGEAGVRRGVGWIVFERLLEILDRGAQCLTGTPVPEEPSADVQLVGLRINPARAWQDRSILGDPYANLIGDGAGHVAVEREDVA